MRKPNCRVRRGLPLRGDPDNPHTGTDAPRERVHRTMDRNRTPRVPRPNPDPESTAPRTRPPGRSTSVITTSIARTAPSTSDRQSKSRRQGQKPSSPSAVFGAVTCSEGSSTSTRSRRDQGRIGFPAPSRLAPPSYGPFAHRSAGNSDGPLDHPESLLMPIRVSGTHKVVDRDLPRLELGEFERVPGDAFEPSLR